MNAAENEGQLRPELVFRVGVSGHLDLKGADGKLREAVEACLGIVRGEIERLAHDPAARRVYQVGPDGAVSFKLRVVSPLAAGADRLVAEAAVGAELYAPIPFSQAEYELDFPESVAPFRTLLAKAQVLVLDGLHDTAEGQKESYAACGRYVVRNCDLLIGIWDGEPPRGLGGTGDIISFAARLGVPVWWIPSSGAGPARLLRSVADFYAPARAPAGEAAAGQLRALLAQAILPPRAPAPEGEGPLGWIAALLPGSQTDRPPIEAFLDDGPPPTCALWKTYSLFLGLIAPENQRASRPPAELEKSTRDAWGACFDAADLASRAYGDRYRSSYILIALLAVFVLVSAAVAANAKGWIFWFGGVLEFVSLAFIMALVICNYAGRWHERWITYRLFAEVCRTQRVLARIGQSLPGLGVSQLVLDEKAARTPRDSWIAWLFLAHRRCAKLPVGRMADKTRPALAKGRALFERQVAYHRSRRARALLAGKWVRRGSDLAFTLTIVIAVVKLAVAWSPIHDMFDWIVLLGVMASAAAGAFVGVRAYAEFDLLARQSAHMLRILKPAEAELDALEDQLDKPLASPILGRTLLTTTTAMMQDITGWSHLFRVKALEAGG